MRYCQNNITSLESPSVSAESELLPLYDQQGEDTEAECSRVCLQVDFVFPLSMIAQRVEWRAEKSLSDKDMPDSVMMTMITVEKKNGLDPNDHRSRPPSRPFKSSLNPSTLRRREQPAADNNICVYFCCWHHRYWKAELKSLSLITSSRLNELVVSHFFLNSSLKTNPKLYSGLTWSELVARLTRVTVCNKDFT